MPWLSPVRKETRLESALLQYNEKHPSAQQLRSFPATQEQKPDAEEQVQELVPPGGKTSPGVNADRFATLPSPSFEITPGRYKVSITSDDGRFFVDEANWSLVIGTYEPETDEAVLELSRRHTFEIEHFEAGGFATLSFHAAVARGLVRCSLILPVVKAGTLLTAKTSC